MLDGNGISEIVALFILTEETKETIETVLNVFKAKNGSWEKSKVIMSDKNFEERRPLGIASQMHLFCFAFNHTLRTFRREVTCEKMAITSAQRLHPLEILQKIAYSKNDTEYLQNVELLKKNKYKSVADYFYEN